MSDSGLNSVLQVGREEQIAYYEDRFKGISPSARHAMAKLFAKKPIGMDPEWVIDGLSESYPEEKATALFKCALDQGIIDVQKDGYCRIPIGVVSFWCRMEGSISGRAICICFGLHCVIVLDN